MADFTKAELANIQRESNQANNEVVWALEVPTTTRKHDDIGINPCGSVADAELLEATATEVGEAYKWITSNDL